MQTFTVILLFSAPNFVTVLISWLNLDIGFDVCFVYTTFNKTIYKVILQLAFPAYAIVLVIIVMWPVRVPPSLLR